MLAATTQYRLRPTSDPYGVDVIHRTKNSSVLVLALVVGAVVFMGHPESRALAQQQAGAKEAIYKCDTPGIQLEGLLTQRTFYGRPGFGETPAKDAREKVYLLKLRRPVTMTPIDDPKAKTCWDAFPHVREVQLFIPPESKIDASGFLGKTVLATGTIRESDAPSEHTKVTMDVKTLQGK